MTDVDLLTGALAVRVAEVPGVVRLHGRRLGGTVRSAADLLATLTADRGVDARPGEDGLDVRVDVAVSDDAPTSDTVRAVAEAVEDALRRDGTPLARVRVRVVSVEPAGGW